MTDVGEDESTPSLPDLVAVGNGATTVGGETEIRIQALVELLLLFANAWAGDDDTRASDALVVDAPAPAPAPVVTSASMAIDHILYPERHDLARAEKGFYPVKIPVSHWQLRHYISTPEPNHLYYASSSDIYCLNTATKKRKHIATLPFEARCTASGHGYVCVGGEDEGHFAAIKLNGSWQRPLDVDSALPLGTFGQGVGRRVPTVKVERIGEEIVNSISIHRIQDEEAHLDDIVAVLTNNDRTVRLYSLPQGQETKCIHLPFAINHATISPDGQLLVAVGDYNQAYFYRREIMDTPPQIPKPHNRLTSASIRWERLCQVTLHVSQPETTMGYFTTAWSPNSSLVAVGSEGGYITILDRDLLENPTEPSFNDGSRDEAIVAVVPSSRADCPSPHPGAVRSMMFSPDPWDLLVWAEDQGRVCIGDLRTGLKSRQIIALEPKEESLKTVDLEDMPIDEDGPISPPFSSHSLAPHLDDLEADLLRRYRLNPDSTSAVNFATEYIEARRRRQAARQELANRSQAGAARSRQSPATQAPDDDSQGLTSHEQQVLDGLRTSRQREEARAGGQIPRSINYVTSDSLGGPGARSSSGPPSTTQSDSARPISEILNSVQESFPELSRTHATSHRPGSSHDVSEEVPQDGAWGTSTRSSSTRITESSRLPRRRSVYSPPTSNSGASASRGNTARRDQSFSTTPAREEDEGDENPWRTIEAEMAATARGPLFEGAARAMASSPLPAERERERRERIIDSLQQDLDEQRRIATAQARMRERWNRSRLVAGGSAGDRPMSLTEARRLASFPEGGYDTILRRTQLRGISGREIGVRTAGLAMSPDGRTLWAACEDGIFEVDVSIKSRMFVPACDPR